MKMQLSMVLAALIAAPSMAAGPASSGGTVGTSFDGNEAGLSPSDGTTVRGRRRRPIQPKNEPGENASPAYYGIPSSDRETGTIYSDLPFPEQQDKENKPISIPGVKKPQYGVTQLRPGEKVEVDQESPDKDWLHVNIPSQNFSGWVRRQDVSPDEGLASQFPSQASPSYGDDQKLTKERRSFVDETKTWDGTPYQWGGMKKKVGVDCSGLVKGSMDNIGMGAKVPRTADEQYKASKHISDGKDLQGGDLVFFSKNGKIHHVMVYLGGGEVREAMMHGTKVGEKSFSSRIGASPENVSNGSKERSQQIFFGTFF